MKGEKNDDDKKNWVKFEENGKKGWETKKRWENMIR
jgi:hypothetical protein